MNASTASDAVVALRAPDDARTARLWYAVCALAEPPPPAPSRPVAARDSSSLDRGVGRAASPTGQGFAEQLVFEFDEAYTTFVEGFVELPSEPQLLSLQAVDARLSSMVRAKDATLWTERARREEPVWQEVRALAAEVLVAFAWPSAARI